MNYQCPNCKSPRVSAITEMMLCHNCGLSEYLYDYANAFDNPMAEPEVEAEPVQMFHEVSPSAWERRLESLKAEVTHIHKVHHERISKKKKYREYSEG